jgi:F0F1-type ATP synthase membrane subunit b/b'
LRKRNVRKKVFVLLAAAFVGLSGGAACGQAVEDEVRQRVEEKVEQGKQRAKEEVEKGKQRLEREGQKAKKGIEQEVQKVRKQAEEKAGTRR